MGIPVSLSAAEFALLMGLAIVLILVAAFVALFLSAIIGAGIARLLYVGGNWCVKRVRQSYSPDDMQSRVTGSTSGTCVTSVRNRGLRLETRL
jgi:hypothetical protein